MKKQLQPGDWSSPQAKQKQIVTQTDPELAGSLYRVIHERRSIRRFENTPISRDVLQRVLEAATWAPSAHNRQPWRFAVLVTAESQQQLAEAMAARLEADLKADGISQDMIEKDTSRSKRRLTGATVLIVVCLTMTDMDQYPDQRRQRFEHMMAVQGVAMAAQNLLLAAHAEGLGSVWMCAPLFCQDTVRATLNLPAHWEPQGVIALGYPAEERTKSREPLATRVVYR